MARLLTLLLLDQHGYEVRRYVSLERIIEQTKGGYADFRAIRGSEAVARLDLKSVDYDKFQGHFYCAVTRCF